MSDYIIVGAGLSGCVLAARLSQAGDSVLLLEAGSETRGHPLTDSPLACFAAHGSDLDWNYLTVPQKHLNGRQCYAAAGRGIGGSTAVNYGTWTRGSPAAYDSWANAVGDVSFSYEQMQPYLNRVEEIVKPVGVLDSNAGRLYPLREKVKELFHGEDLSELKETWKDGKRQMSRDLYNLSEVELIKDALVEKLTFDGAAVKGVQLVDGRSFIAKKEVIVCAGAYRTPQLLQLSGIGPAEHLKSHGIPIMADLPVGHNLYDHLSFFNWWRLASPWKSMGSPEFNNPAFTYGLPCDWVGTAQLPDSELESAFAADSSREGSGGGRYQTETITAIYAPAGASTNGFDIPLDGTIITTVVVGMTPTSRGTVMLKSTDPKDAPLIDPNYYATEVDRAVMRAEIRKVTNLYLDTPLGREIVAEEVVAAGCKPLPVNPTDEEVDERVKATAATIFHPAGSAAMGKVVDTKFKVLGGVQGLRVVDASVFPVSIDAHFMACLYAVSERAADVIIAGNESA